MSFNAEIAAHEAEIKEYKLQLETVQLGLQADPDNAELQELKTELEQVISLTEATIAELKPPAASAAPAPKREPARTQHQQQPDVKEKWSRENHPAFKKSTPTPAAAEDNDASQTTFKVNDTVLAKWNSGDRGFYPARITSITGSSTAPIYIVKFKSYDTVETLRAHQIKAINSKESNSNSSSSISSSTKRKADGTPIPQASSSFTPPPPQPDSPSQHHSSVISAVADIDPILAQQTKKEPSKVSDGPARPAKAPKKIKANKELEAGKSKWQDFAAKGGKMGKAGMGKKKDSMFRTPDGINGRVGFTGSGQQMRKDPTRSRHIYQQGEEEYQ